MQKPPKELDAIVDVEYALEKAFSKWLIKHDELYRQSDPTVARADKEDLPQKQGVGRQ